MSWLLNIAYSLFLLAASPLLIYRRLVHGKYRGGWGEKFFGRLPHREGDKPAIWLHAVSVGEVLQLETVVAELLNKRPDVEIVITTTTATGLAVAKDKFPQQSVCYYPLDFSWAVRNAVDRIRPNVVVLVELELWPNFINEVHRRGIPLLLINGRISEKSFNGYRRIAFLMRRLLPCLHSLAVQNETYAQRLRELGAPPDRILVTGSIKFDRVNTSRTIAATQELQRSFGLTEDDVVFIAGSTHSPEEQIAIETWTQLREDFPNLRLILVPRHKERFPEVARLVEARELPLLKRSSLKSEVGNRMSEGNRSQTSDVRDQALKVPQVILLDTLGELSACWGLADVAFVGGSLTSRGGQNMIEPAGYGAAVLFGPNTRNFRDVVDMLLDGDAARVVQNGSELRKTLRQLLIDRQSATAMGHRAQRLVLAQQGATRRTVAIIVAAIPVSRSADGKRAA